MVSSQVQQWLLESPRAEVDDSDSELGISSGHPAMQHPSPQHQLVSALSARWEGRGPAHPLLTRRHWSVASGLGERASVLGALGDEYKESHRRRLRTVFNFERWRRHRSAKRYLRHMFGLRGQHRADDAGAAYELPSKLRGMWQPLVYVGLWTAGVAGYHYLAELGLVPRPPSGFDVGSSAPFQLTSFALSLLLVFRTNASYSRWLDARKTWGSVVNRTRDLVRQGLTYIPPDQPELRAMLCRWVPAFSVSLRCALRADEDAEEELPPLLRPREAAAALAADHRPSYCLQVLSCIVREAQALPQPPAAAGQQQRRQQAAAAPRCCGGCLRPALCMDPNLTALEDAVGTCERILRTPIPLLYTRHTSRFLLVWLTLLPFTLWQSCRWAMVPLTLIIAFFLLGIEEIGVQIEEPFSILPLEHICATIERDVRELLAMHSGGGAGGGLGIKGEAADALVAAAVRRGGGSGSTGPAAAAAAAAAAVIQENGDDS